MSIRDYVVEPTFTRRSSYGPSSPTIGLRGAKTRRADRRRRSAVLHRARLPRHGRRRHRRARRSLAGHAVPVLREQGSDLRRADVRVGQRPQPGDSPARHARRHRRGLRQPALVARRMDLGLRPLRVDVHRVDERQLAEGPVAAQAGGVRRLPHRTLRRRAPGQRVHRVEPGRRRRSWPWLCSPASTTSATSTAPVSTDAELLDSLATAVQLFLFPDTPTVGVGRRAAQRTTADDLVGAPTHLRHRTARLAAAARLDPDSRPVRRTQCAGGADGAPVARRIGSGVRRERLRRRQRRPDRDGGRIWPVARSTGTSPTSSS